MLGQVSDSVEDLVIIATSQAHDERHEFDALKLNVIKNLKCHVNNDC